MFYTYFPKNEEKSVFSAKNQVCVGVGIRFKILMITSAYILPIQ